MPVSFTFPANRAVDLVKFGWSPLHEAVLSLRAVAQPKRTPMHLPWARRCRELPDDLLAEIRLLTRPFHRFIPGLFEVGLLGDSPRFADELEALGGVDDDTVSYELSLAFGDVPCDPGRETDRATVHTSAFRDQVLAGAAADPELLALARDALDDPAGVRDRYVAMLARYWDEAFHEEWDRILPRIEAEVTDGARALVTGGPSALVSSLLPEGRWDAASSSIVIAKDWDGECDVAERGQLLFVPTVYGWPQVLIELDRPWPPSVMFPLRELRRPEVPHASDHQVVSGFRALGDETRLQIARLVAESPRSTKELAELLSLSDSAISRNLKILEAAGMVSGQRDGYFVLYRLDPERLDVLTRTLHGTLGLAHAAGGGEVPALPVSVARAR